MDGRTLFVTRFSFSVLLFITELWLLPKHFILQNWDVTFCFVVNRNKGTSGQAVFFVYHVSSFFFFFQSLTQEEARPQVACRLSLLSSWCNQKLTSQGERFKNAAVFCMRARYHCHCRSDPPPPLPFIFHDHVNLNHVASLQLYSYSI